MAQWFKVQWLNGPKFKVQWLNGSKSKVFLKTQNPRKNSEVLSFYNSEFLNF